MAIQTTDPNASFNGPAWLTDWMNKNTGGTNVASTPGNANVPLGQALGPNLPATPSTIASSTATTPAAPSTVASSTNPGNLPSWAVGANDKINDMNNWMADKITPSVNGVQSVIDNATKTVGNAVGDVTGPIGSIIGGAGNIVSGALKPIMDNKYVGGVMNAVGAALGTTPAGNDANQLAQIGGALTGNEDAHLPGYMGAQDYTSSSSATPQPDNLNGIGGAIWTPLDKGYQMAIDNANMWNARAQGANGLKYKDAQNQALAHLKDMQTQRDAYLNNQNAGGVGDADAVKEMKEAGLEANSVNSSLVPALIEAWKAGDSTKAQVIAQEMQRDQNLEAGIRKQPGGSVTGDAIDSTANGILPFVDPTTGQINPLKLQSTIGGMMDTVKASNARYDQLLKSNRVYDATGTDKLANNLTLAQQWNASYSKDGNYPAITAMQSELSNDKNTIPAMEDQAGAQNAEANKIKGNTEVTGPLAQIMAAAKSAGQVLNLTPQQFAQAPKIKQDQLQAALSGPMTPGKKAFITKFNADYGKQQ